MPSLISELKRRNVFRVGTAYVLVARLVAQARYLLADTPAFRAPVKKHTLVPTDKSRRQ